jgi:hypothetical protein
MDEFNESLQKIGEHIYQQAGAKTGGGSSGPEGAAGDGEQKKDGDEVVDADYREVN